MDRVTLVPDGNEFGIVLRGDLAANLSFAAGKKKLTSAPPPFAGRAAWRFSIAGIGGCRDTQYPILAIGREVYSKTSCVSRLARLWSERKEKPTCAVRLHPERK